MIWTAHRVTWRLLAPMHIGWRKLGNLQQTRPYVTGRNLWGALTARLTRELGSGDYKGVGEQVDEYITFTYFYPSVHKDKVGLWPWPKPKSENTSQNEIEDQWEKFAWQFLGSYASTALQDGRSAEANSLHETEFIAPYTRDKQPDTGDGQPVYLVGYIFEKDGCQLDWKNALDKIQLGGERSYGWGRILLEHEPFRDNTCFGYTLEYKGRYPQITIPKKTRGRTIPNDGALLAHTYAKGLNNVSNGIIEPLVGRETSSVADFGKNHSQAQICWTPGSTINTTDAKKTFQIQARGIWKEIVT